MKLMNFLQRLGRALQLPISVLPIAALMLRFGQPDLLNCEALKAAGAGVFDDLPLIFAIGVASAWSYGSAGEAALAGGVGHLVLTKTLNVVAPGSNMGPLSGIVAGVLAGACYNRVKDSKLPDFLAFFSGKRSVPILSGVMCALLGFACGWIWPPLQRAIELMGAWLLRSGPLGSFGFGVLNRLLLPFGLHQILNNYVWYQLGTYHGADGACFEGDMERFYAGDPTAGSFMGGFFPPLMMGLPVACWAMYRSVSQNRRVRVKGMLASMACTALVTGITEPIEFSFMFLAPALYLLHAVLTGLSLALASALGIHAGFSFSAGLVDYLLNFNLPAARRVLWILPLGLIFSVLYGLLFRLAITYWDLPTPGRDGRVNPAPPAAGREGEVASAYLSALGGPNNLEQLEACITRLRLSVRDEGRIDEQALLNLGAKALVRLGSGQVQVVVGTQAEALCEVIRSQMRGFEAGGLV